MTADPRADRSRRSILALRDFLEEICKRPGDFLSDSELRDALKSQGSLACMKLSDKGIEPTSINTQKRHGEVIAGGFEALDKLRQRAKALLDAKEKQGAKRYGTRAALEQSVSELRDSLATLRADLMVSTQVIDLALRQGRSYAEEAGPSVAARCKKEQRELLAFLSVRSNPISSGE